MNQLRQIFTLTLFLMLPMSFVFGQAVIGNDALTSNRYRKSSVLSSTIYSPGATGISLSSGSMLTGAGVAAPMFQVTRMKSFSPSGSSYSSYIQSPFNLNSPQSLRRDNDDDDLPGEPSVNPGDPGDPMPVGDGVAWLLALCAGWIIYKRIENRRQPKIPMI